MKWGKSGIRFCFVICVSTIFFSSNWGSKYNFRQKKKSPPPSSHHGHSLINGGGHLFWWPISTLINFVYHIILLLTVKYLYSVWYNIFNKCKIQSVLIQISHFSHPQFWIYDLVCVLQKLLNCKENLKR